MVKTRPILLALALCTPALAWGQAALEAPNWDSNPAMQSARTPDSEAQVQKLISLLERGESARLNSELDRVIAGASLSKPARDFILFRFTVGLADFEEVDPGVLTRLRNVEPMVLVPHEERAHVGVPLFNIAGAAEGVLQLGLRREARAQAERAVGESPQAWLDAYLLASRSQRRGFGDALEGAPDAALSPIVDAAVQRLPSEPELTPVAGKSALLLGDAAALGKVVRFGSGSELAAILEAAGLTLHVDDAMTLLEAAVAKAPAANASLAIAQLYPELAGRPEASALLFDRISDADLGAAAALALAESGGPAVRADLRRIAQSGDGPAARRATAALELQSRGEGQHR